MTLDFCKAINSQNFKELKSTYEDQMINRIITFVLYWSQPFSTLFRKNSSQVYCGAFLGFLIVVSAKYNYRFEIIID